MLFKRYGRRLCMTFCLCLCTEVLETGNPACTALSRSPLHLFVFLFHCLEIMCAYWIPAERNAQTLQCYDVMASKYWEQGRSNMNSSHLPWHSLTTVFSSTEEAISMKSLQAYYWQQDQKDRKTPLAPPPQWHSEDKLTEKLKLVRFWCTHWLWQDKQRVTLMFPLRKSFLTGLHRLYSSMCACM